MKYYNITHFKIQRFKFKSQTLSLWWKDLDVLVYYSPPATPIISPYDSLQPFMDYAATPISTTTLLFRSFNLSPFLGK